MPNVGGVVTISDTETFSPQDDKPSQQGSTIAFTSSAVEMEPRNSLQQTDMHQAFQEVQMAVGEFARKMQISPRAATYMVIQLLNQLYTSYYS